MEERRLVRLFKNGRNQAVRIPRELELPGQEALLYREGNRLVLEPLSGASLLGLMASWKTLEAGWPEIDDPVPRPVALTD